MIAKTKKQAIFARYGGHCAYCGKPMQRKNMTVDHLVPQSRGGGNNIENLMPSCRSCNGLKAADSLEVFRYRFFWDSLKPSELATYDSMAVGMGWNGFILKPALWIDYFLFMT